MSIIETIPTLTPNHLQDSQSLVNAIYHGEVFHARRGAKEHSFRYPLSLFLVDLQQLTTLKSELKYFSYNHFNLYAIHDSDYLDDSPGSILSKLNKLLVNNNLAQPVTVKLLTAPRLLGYIFNPVSFYYCYDDDQQLYCVIAEVNNTFRERHLYVLKDLEYYPLSGTYSADAVKEFYVSPFYEVQGNYSFRLTEPDQVIDLRVHKYQGPLINNGEQHPPFEFITRFRGTAVPLNNHELWQNFMHKPLNAWMAMPRIMYEAARLYYQKKLPIIRKPIPMSSMTIRVAPLTQLQNYAARLFLNYLKPITRGQLTLHFPDQTTHQFGGAEPGPQAQLVIRNPEFFSHVVKHGNIGLGESYTRGDWDADDVTAFLKIICINSDKLNHSSVIWTWLGEAANRLLHWQRRNNIHNSRKNIHEHYDLSNKFFAAFLDPTMAYSSALFSTPDEPLEQAQLNKIHRLLKQARISPDHHLLEIGCGWGRLAIEAARTYGCKVTGISLSTEQLKFAEEQIAAAGLKDKIELKFCDYRQLTGQFDRIISVEMLEAVGHKYLGTYFQKLDSLLKPQGLAVLQSITIADQFYETYRHTCDWIQKHIFPGGHLPSVTAVSQALTRNSSLVMHELMDFAPHYGETLRRWRVNFNQQLQTIKDLGFDEEFIRKWNYYLMYCEAGFDTQRLGLAQFTLKRHSEAGPFELSCD